jgi:hypothetical protein
MDADLRQFADTFAQAVIAREYERAQAMLADWLQPTVSAATLQAMIEREVREVCEANAIAADLHPQSWQVSSNSSSLEAIREPQVYTSVRNSGWLGEAKRDAAGKLVSPVADGFTAGQFRQWLAVQFMPSDESQQAFGIDAFLDFWMAVAEVDGEYRIGYFEIEDPD